MSGSGKLVKADCKNATQRSSLLAIYYYYYYYY